MRSLIWVFAGRTYPKASFSCFVARLYEWYQLSDPESLILFHTSYSSRSKRMSSLLFTSLLVALVSNLETVVSVPQESGRGQITEDPEVHMNTVSMFFFFFLFFFCLFVFLLLFFVVVFFKCKWIHLKTRHYDNTLIQIYWKFYHQKTESFQIKMLIFFKFLLKT